MLSQQQNDRHVPEEETPPPLDQEHAATSTSPWQGWSLWLRVLGVVVALAAGVALTFIANMPDWGWGLLIPPLAGIVSGGLLRTWRAMLIVPIVFSVALFLGTVLALSGFDQMDIGTGDFYFVVFIFAFVGVVPLALGVAIGTLIGKMIEQRLQH